MVLRRTKTIILFLLVTISLVTSYAIWHGSWLVHSEVGLSESSGQAATSTVPELASVTAPQQVVLAQGRPQSYNVQLPGTVGYQHWLAVLKTMTLSPLRSVGDFTLPDNTPQVTFDFAVSVNRNELSSFIPALNTATLTPPTDEVVLYQQRLGGKVQLAIETGAETFLGTTNLNSTTFVHSVDTSIEAQPWHLLSNTPLTLVPDSPLPIKQYQCTLKQPKITALVNSFFVNTQAVTRIRENKGTVLFTDGSRAVQWNTTAAQMTFEDPNAASSTPEQPVSLSSILHYVGSHGGIPQNALVYTDPTSSSPNYIFREIVNGLPILNPVQSYRVLLEQGHIVEYDRPLQEISDQMQSVTAKTISFNQLTQALNKAGYSVNKVQIVFGYKLEVQGRSTGVLEPVYFISQQDNHVATVDAVTGVVTKGGSKS